MKGCITCKQRPQNDALELESKLSENNEAILKDSGCWWELNHVYPHAESRNPNETSEPLHDD